MENMSAAALAERTKYTAEKTVVGGITYVTMHGTLGEDFEGRKLAASIRTKKAVVNLNDVHRLASWGMSEWMDFLRICADHDLYIVECSTYAVTQLNLVTGLLGHAKLVSFYATYRCRSCGDEIQELFLIPKERAEIRDITNHSVPCPKCNAAARLDDYPAAFSTTIADRPPFDIDDEVLAFMRSRLSYDLSPDLTRFRAFRRHSDGFTYLRLSGNPATLPSESLSRASEGATVVDLTKIVFERNDLAAWRAYLGAASSRVKSLQLLGCPPGFLESAVTPDNLRSNVKVRTFAVRYECGTCGTQQEHTVDVAANLEDLVRGVLPVANCTSCRSGLPSSVTPDLAAVLRALPARDRDHELDAFLAKSIAQPNDKLENCLTARHAAMPNAPRSGRGRYLVLGGVVLAAAALVAVTRLTAREPTHEAQGAQAPAPQHPTFVRPEWIISDAPADAYCHDLVNRLMCVGVSTYRANKEDGVADATNAALDELVNAIGLKIQDPFFKDTVSPGYGSPRTKALSGLQASEIERGSGSSSAADGVLNARRLVAQALLASGGAAVPAQRTDWYWEEYARDSGTGTEFLVFVRYDVPNDALSSLIDRYAATAAVLGNTVMTAFPALAWQHPSFAGGALLTKVSPELAAAGVAPLDVITAVGDQRVTDSASLAKQIDASTTGEIKLTVVKADAQPRVVLVKK